jgi:hypothetical protein
MGTQTIRNVEYFAEGRFNGMDFDSRDLDEIVRAFRELHLDGRLPAKFGHNGGDDEPAQGWITNLHREGDKLLCDLTDVPDTTVAAIKAGRWKHVSAELLANLTAANGRTYRYAPDGIALLGAARPAIASLAPLDKLVASAFAGAHWGSRVALQFAYRTGDTDMSDESGLRAENARLTREVIALKFSQAIKDGRLLPRDEYAFGKRFPNPTLRDAEEWIAQSPAPPSYARRSGAPTSHTARVDGEPRGEVREYARPDAQLTYLAKKLVAEAERLGKTLTFSAAKQVILEDPAFSELAVEYMQMPGTE